MPALIRVNQPSIAAAAHVATPAPAVALPAAQTFFGDGGPITPPAPKPTAAALVSIGLLNDFRHVRSAAQTVRSAAQTFFGDGGPVTPPTPKLAAAAAPVSIGLLNDFRHVRFLA